MSSFVFLDTTGKAKLPETLTLCFANLSKRMSFGRLPLIVTDGFEFYQKVIRRFFGPAVVFYIESRRFLIRDSPRPATTYEQKTGGADGVKGA